MQRRTKMLETEIIKLREAIEANTLAIQAMTKPQFKPKLSQEVASEIMEKSEATYELKEKPEQEQNAPTVKEVKELSKIMMSGGVSRQDIKKVITDLGVERIDDLDEEGLSKLFVSLKGM